MRNLTICLCTGLVLLATVPAYAQPAGNPGADDPNIYIITVTAYQRGEPYASMTFQPATRMISSYWTGAQNGQVGFWVMQDADGKEAVPEFASRELSTLAGKIQHASICGYELAFFSSAADWIEVDVRSCPRRDLANYRFVLDFNQQLDRDIYDRLFQPAGRLAFAPTRHEPVTFQ